MEHTIATAERANEIELLLSEVDLLDNELQQRLTDCEFVLNDPEATEQAYQEQLEDHLNFDYWSSGFQHFQGCLEKLKELNRLISGTLHSNLSVSIQQRAEKLDQLKERHSLIRDKFEWRLGTLRDFESNQRELEGDLEQIEGQISSIEIATDWDVQRRMDKFQVDLVVSGRAMLFKHRFMFS